jgi:GxxExxY protein
MHLNRPDRRVKLVEQALTHEIIGGFFEAYNELGFGFRESIYKRGLEITLRRRGLVVEREFPVEVFFQGTQIGFHRIDMLVEGRVIVEAKATHKLRYADKLQLMNYLAAMNLEVGLLLHFGPTAQFVRVLGPRRSIVQRRDPENSTNPEFPPNESSS